MSLEFQSVAQVVRWLTLVQSPWFKIWLRPWKWMAAASCKLKAWKQWWETQICGVKVSWKGCLFFLGMWRMKGDICCGSKSVSPLVPLWCSVAAWRVEDFLLYPHFIIKRKRWISTNFISLQKDCGTSIFDARWFWATSAFGVDMSWKLWMYQPRSSGQSTCLLSTQLFCLKHSSKPKKSRHEKIWLPVLRLVEWVGNWCHFLVNYDSTFGSNQYVWPCENENLTRHFHSPLDDDHVLSVCRSRFLWRTHRSSWLQTSGSFWETHQNNHQTWPYLFKLWCGVGQDVTPNSCSLCTVVFPMYCVFTLDPFGFLLRNLETFFPSAFQGGLRDYFYHWSIAGALWGLDFLGLRARLYIVHHDEPPIELDVVGLTGQCQFLPPSNTHFNKN